MSKVYMLSCGCYSDYEVLGIYSTREKAEHYRKIFEREETNDVEEIELDAPPFHDEERNEGWEFKFDNGKIIDSFETSVFDYKFSYFINGIHVYFDGWGSNRKVEAVFVSNRNGMTFEKAKKIAVDKYYEYTANKEGLV